MGHEPEIPVAARLKPWMEGYHFELVTPANIDRIVDECIAAVHYGFDLETTSLDTRVFTRFTENGEVSKVETDVVGICLSPGDKKAYYLPILHFPKGFPSPANLPFSVWDGPIRRLLTAPGTHPIVHNCKFEGEIMSFPGGAPYGDWDDTTWWEDTQILAYLSDSNRKKIGLKTLSSEFLGKEQIELEELFPRGTEELNFSKLDPLDPLVLAYGASDAVCTRELYFILKPLALNLPSRAGNMQHSQDFIYKIEKLCVCSVRWMERSRLPIDLDLVAHFIQLARTELISSLQELYAGASEILGRDITPLSFYYVLQAWENEPEWKSLKISTDSNAKTLKSLFDDCKLRAEQDLKNYSKGDLSVRQRFETDPKLESFFTRIIPPPKSMDGVPIILQTAYDVMSSAQLGILLFDLGIQGLQKTATGQIKTSADVLNSVIEDNQEALPFMKKVKGFRGNDQALKNLVNLWKDTDRRDGTLRISFRAYAAGTGRFSSKGDKNPRVTGGTKFNLQSMPAGKDPRSPEALLRIRECILARGRKHKKANGETAQAEKIMVVIDFSGVELRIVANVSGEKKWIEQFFRCSDCEMEWSKEEWKVNKVVPPKYCPRCGSDKIGDIHTLTAIQIYGEDAPSKPEWKIYRGRGKNTNFALNYGGGPSAVERQTGVSRQEAYRIVEKFKGSYKGLTAWQQIQFKFAREHGYVLTAFCRKYPVPDINHTIPWIQKKAERNAINSPIQGASADITKLAMGLVFRRCQHKGWLDKVEMLLTMHDELVFQIDVDILEEAIAMLVDTMTSNQAILMRKWPVPLTVDVELGKTWKAKYNLYEIEYMVGLRRKLQQPGLSHQEVEDLLRCVLGFFGGKMDLLKKIKSFEEMRWPDLLQPHFASGREDMRPYTPEEKEALAFAWALLFPEDDTGVAAWKEAKNALVAPTRTTLEAPPEELRYTIQTGMELATAAVLSEAMFSSQKEGGIRLQLVDPAGNLLIGWDDWAPDGVFVDPEKFQSMVSRKLGVV